MEYASNNLCCIELSNSERQLWLRLRIGDTVILRASARFGSKGSLERYHDVLVASVVSSRLNIHGARRFMCAQHVMKKAAQWVFVGLMMSFIGCGSRQNETDAAVRKSDRQQQRIRHGNVNFAAMDVRGFDINADGTPDVLYYSKDGVVRVVRYDLDFDGRVDMDVYYGVDGSIEERSYYLNDDEKVDVIGLYETDILVEKYVSIDFDGNFPVVKHYDSQGELLRVERDSDGDGHTDVWEYYDAGELVRVARDTDGDGSPDQVSEIQ